MEVCLLVSRLRYWGECIRSPLTCFLCAPTHLPHPVSGLPTTSLTAPISRHIACRCMIYRAGKHLVFFDASSLFFASWSEEYYLPRVKTRIFLISPLFFLLVKQLSSERVEQLTLRRPLADLVNGLTNRIFVKHRNFHCWRRRYPIKFSDLLCNRKRFHSRNCCNA